jgi:hypothetical protein
MERARVQVIEAVLPERGALTRPSPGHSCHGLDDGEAWLSTHVAGAATVSRRARETRAPPRPRRTLSLQFRIEYRRVVESLLDSTTVTMGAYPVVGSSVVQPRTLKIRTVVALAGIN